MSPPNMTRQPPLYISGTLYIYDYFEPTSVRKERMLARHTEVTYGIPQVTNPLTWHPSGTSSWQHIKLRRLYQLALNDSWEHRHLLKTHNTLMMWFNMLFFHGLECWRATNEVLFVVHLIRA